MSRGAYYNENDPFAAQWLRNLIAAGHIAPGEVDDRSIIDVRADDLRGFTQRHFFAGIGVWSYALRLAGWPDELEVWTASCPCQPFSDAGRKGGLGDERHLWPHFFGLARELGALRILGEQVASADGRAWLDFVSADLEGAGYTVGALDTCAAGFGAPHIRQRLYFVADTGRERVRAPGHAEYARASGEDQGPGHQRQRLRDDAGDEGGGATRIMADTERAEDGRLHGGRQDEGAPTELAGPGPCNGFWADADWISCIDGKARPVEPGTFPLAHGAPARVGRLRAYGNAINARQAAHFVRAVRAYLEERGLT